MKSRILALVLIFALALSCFAGCGDSSSSSQSSAPAGDSSADSSAGDTSATPDEQVTAPLTYTTFDYASAYATHAPDELVMTVNGNEIYWEEYFGWIYTIVSEIETYLGTSFVWEDMFSDAHTFGSYTQYYAQAMTTQYSIIYNKAQEMGLELTAEELQVIDDAFANDAVSYAGGDLAAFEDYLESTYMSKDYYYYINTVATFYQRIFDTIYGEKGVNFTDEAVEEFIKANGYLYAKHILFMTVDSAGTPLDEATVAAKRAAAEDTLAQLRAITDTEEMLVKFDELMNSLSEDTGLMSYPDGYYFVPGEMVQQFEDATKALENYGISDIVETDYGYHIILRLPIDPDALYDGTNTFRYMSSTYAFDDIAKGWFDSAEVVYEEGFENIDFNELLPKVEMTADAQ